jgi:hypothetical protein
MEPHGQARGLLSTGIQENYTQARTGELRAVSEIIDSEAILHNPAIYFTPALVMMTFL